MSHDEQGQPGEAVPLEETAALSRNDERFRDLAELEQEIRRRLRSNQRFLEKCLDEDFVDDEEGDDEETDGDDEEL